MLCALQFARVVGVDISWDLQEIIQEPLSRIFRAASNRSAKSSAKSTFPIDFTFDATRRGAGRERSIDIEPPFARRGAFLCYGSWVSESGL